MHTPFYMGYFNFWVAFFVNLFHGIRSGLKLKKMACYRVSLVDLAGGSEAIDTFDLVESSFARAKKMAYGCVRVRSFSYGDIDRREAILEVVRIHEIGAEITAGHEFDVLPDALRRFAINIYAIN
jgi:hypothetical protein